MRKVENDMSAKYSNKILNTKKNHELFMQTMRVHSYAMYYVHNKYISVFFLFVVQ